MMRSDARPTTVEPAQVERFAALAESWWDQNGPFRALHQINPARLSFIRERATRHFGTGGLKPMDGKRVLDVGCGGGLLSEPLARMGATVIGLDAAEENVAAARRHAEIQHLAIDYRAGTAEDLAGSGAVFDLVLALEIIEHVSDPDLFLDACARLVAPSGMIVIGTLNRTLRALALAVVGAEYILGWIPRGTHDWRRFVGPDALSRRLAARGLAPDGVAGLRYSPIERRWRLSRDTSVNYLLSAARP